MSESREITLAGLLRSIQEGPCELEIGEGADVVFFSINGHKFCTYGTWAYNERHPLYGSSALLAMAKKRDTPEEAQEMKDLMERVDLFMEHRAKLLKRIFSTALKVLDHGSEEAFLSYIDTYIDVTEHDEACQPMLKKIEREK